MLVLNPFIWKAGTADQNKGISWMACRVAKV